MVVIIPAFAVRTAMDEMRPCYDRLLFFWSVLLPYPSFTSLKDAIHKDSPCIIPYSGVTM